MKAQGLMQISITVQSFLFFLIALWTAIYTILPSAFISHFTSFSHKKFVGNKRNEEYSSQLNRNKNNEDKDKFLISSELLAMQMEYAQITSIAFKSIDQISLKKLGKECYISVW